MVPIYGAPRQQCSVKVLETMASLTFNSFKLIFLTITTIFILCFSVFSAVPADEPKRRPFNKIYAFGDSFTDTGNTHSETGPSGFAHVSSPPYGATYFRHSTNRYSDGRLVVDFLAQTLALPFLPPYLSVVNGTNSSATSTGVNFAVAGSTAIDHDFFVKNNLTLALTNQSLITQLSWFNKFLEVKGCNETEPSGPKCRAVFDDALFWVGEIGVNDYAYTLGSEIPSDTIRELAIKNVKYVLQSLLKKGAKYVMVQGQPPVGCLTLSMYLASPDDRDNWGCVRSANNVTYHYNIALQGVLHELRVQFPHSVIIYGDYWNAYITVLNNPAKYGFKNLFDACCGSGDTYNYSVFKTCGAPTVGACSNITLYINWDGVHLTESMYKVMFDFLVRGQLSHPPFSYLMDRKLRQG